MASAIFDLIIKMYLRDNFAHADLHSGNAIYEPSSNSIVVLDAGLTSKIPPENRFEFGRLAHAICTGDAEVRLKIGLGHLDGAHYG